MVRKVALFEGNDIDELYKQITTCIITEGDDIDFGDAKEVKQAREIFAVTHIYGRAIQDIIDGKTPKGFIWSGEKIKMFQQQFIEEYLNPTGFEYTYSELLRDYPVGEGKTVNQLEISKKLLAYDKGHELQSNRNVGILYHPKFAFIRDKPCFNWYQIRYLGNGKVSIVLLFRSHDFGDALWANLCSIIYCFVVFVTAPNVCVVDEVILVSASGHFYEYSSQQAENITGLKWMEKYEY